MARIRYEDDTSFAHRLYWRQLLDETRAEMEKENPASCIPIEVTNEPEDIFDTELAQ